MGMLQKLMLNSYFSIGGGSEITISTLWKDSKDGRSALPALGRQLRNTQHVDARKFRRSSRQESGSCAANSARVNVEIRASRSKALVVADRLREPRNPKNSGGTDGGASVLPRTRRTSPVVFGRIDCAGAHMGTVERTNIPDPDADPEQSVEMDVDLSRGIDRYVDILIADDILGNDGAANRRSAIAAIDVDSHTARGGGVEEVGKVSGNGVADDLVPTHVIWREPKRGSDVRVQSDASESVTGESISDDHVV